MKKTIALLFLTISSLTFSQAPNIEWQKCLGGTSDEFGEKIKQTSDGGYILTGRTKSSDGDINGNHSFNQQDGWVVKLNSTGTIQWQKCLGGSGPDVLFSIQETSDNGFIVAGQTESNDGDVAGNHGSTDGWVVKLNSTGTIQWQKCLGGADSELLYTIQETSDNGFIVAGQANSNDGDVSVNHIGSGWVVKLNSTGTIQWQKSLGGSGTDVFYSIQETSDNGFIVGGITNSNNGDVIGNHGAWDAWVVKLNSTGTIQWQKCLGGVNDDRVWDIKQTLDGGYIVAASTNSNDGNVTGNHGGPSPVDSWVVKLNSSSTIDWQRCIGGTGQEFLYEISITSDNGCVLTGITNSNNGDLTGNFGNNDGWVIKLSYIGATEWIKNIGGGGIDGLHSLSITINGGLVLVGGTSSTNVDFSTNHGGAYDIWVVKLSSFNFLEETNSTQINLYPNPAAEKITITTPLDKIGYTYIILDNVGKSVYTSKVEALETVIDLQDLLPGLYFFKLENTREILKIIKQ